MIVHRRVLTCSGFIHTFAGFARFVWRFSCFVLPPTPPTHLPHHTSYIVHISSLSNLCSDMVHIWSSMVRRWSCLSGPCAITYGPRMFIYGTCLNICTLCTVIYEHHMQWRLARYGHLAASLGHRCLRGGLVWGLTAQTGPNQCSHLNNYSNLLWHGEQVSTWNQHATHKIQNSYHSDWLVLATGRSAAWFEIVTWHREQLSAKMYSVAQFSLLGSWSLLSDWPGRVQAPPHGGTVVFLRGG